MLFTIAYCAMLYPGQADQKEEDLRAISIPADAVERRRARRPMGRVTAEAEYFVGDERVARREFYDNGNVAEEKLYRAGKLHGISRQFYWSGELYAERPFRSGVMDGEFRFWDEERTLMGASRIQKGTGLLREFEQPHCYSTDAETPYRDGRIHGLARKWGHFLDCQGTGYESTTYVDGRVEGVSVVRHEDGLLCSWCFFRNGDLDGASTQLKRDGQVADGYPVYFLNSKKVTDEEFRAAAEKDATLAKTLNFRPPMNEKIPESPSNEFTRKKAAEKAKAGKTVE